MGLIDYEYTSYTAVANNESVKNTRKRQTQGIDCGTDITREGKCQGKIEINYQKIL